MGAILRNAAGRNNRQGCADAEGIITFIRAGPAGQPSHFVLTAEMLASRSSSSGAAVIMAEQQPTFLSWRLMTPAERGDFVLQRIMRVLRLFKKYGITDLRGLDFDADNSWRKLALALAERHEPDFSSRKRGRDKKYDDDVELILMVELLRCRGELSMSKVSISKACKAIAEKGAIKGKARTLQDRYKALAHHRHWKGIIKWFEMAKAKVGVGHYIEVLEEVVGGKLK